MCESGWSAFLINPIPHLACMIFLSVSGWKNEVCFFKLFWFWGLISIVSGEFIALINDVPWISLSEECHWKHEYVMTTTFFIPAEEGGC